MIQTHGHVILKSGFSRLCLIVGVIFISRVLEVSLKTNNVSFDMPFLCDVVFVRCRFCEVPFILGACFAR